MKTWYWIAGIVILGGVFGGSDDDAPSRAAPVSLASQAAPSSTQTSTRETVQTLFVTGNRVNQRTGPGTSYSVIGQLNKNDRVHVVEQSGGWSHITSPLGDGWMSSNYLSENRVAVSVVAQTSRTRGTAVPTSRDIQQARQQIIRQSIAAYPGSCPCPYNTDRAGRRCGGRSAWSRPGGYAPLCYESDVSDARVNTYFARRRGASN